MNDLEKSTALVGEFFDRATRAGIDGRSLCMGLLSVALAKLVEMDGSGGARAAFDRMADALECWTNRKAN